MLVDINLLPKKAPRKAGLPVFIIFFLVLTAIGIGLFYWQYAAKQESLASLQSQTLRMEETIAVQSQKIATFESSNSAAELEKIVEWARDYPIETVPVLQHLISFLPERGFFQNFAYNDDGSINLSIQFDSSREAAFYLTKLTESEWINEAKLTGITTSAEIIDLNDQEDNLENESKLINDPFMPRYLALYTLSLNRQTVKDDTEAKESDKELDTKDEAEGENPE